MGIGREGNEPVPRQTYNTVQQNPPFSGFYYGGRIRYLQWIYLPSTEQSVYLPGDFFPDIIVD